MAYIISLLMMLLEPSTALVVNEINNLRSEYSQPALVVDERLVRSAVNKCHHMQEHEYWAHSGGDRDWPEFVREQGVHTDLGENLAKNHPNKNLVNAWYESPAHKDLMLGDYSRVGIGQCDGPVGSLTVKHLSK